MVAILASSGSSSRSRSFARPPARASTRLRARAARGQAGRDFSSKLAWLDSHRIIVNVANALAATEAGAGKPRARAAAGRAPAAHLKRLL